MFSLFSATISLISYTFCLTYSQDVLYQQFQAYESYKDSFLKFLTYSEAFCF